MSLQQPRASNVRPSFSKHQCLLVSWCYSSASAVQSMAWHGGVSHSSNPAATAGLRWFLEPRSHRRSLQDLQLSWQRVLTLWIKVPREKSVDQPVPWDSNINPTEACLSMSKERVQLSSCRCLVYGLAYMRVFTRVSLNMSWGCLQQPHPGFRSLCDATALP